MHDRDMRRWHLPPIVRRSLGAGAAGSILVLLGWLALGGNDAASALMAFPLLSIGATLVLVACGVGAIAIQRVSRGERLSPLAPGPEPLPRAVVVFRR